MLHKIFLLAWLAFFAKFGKFVLSEASEEDHFGSFSFSQDQQFAQAQVEKGDCSCPRSAPSPRLSYLDRPRFGFSGLFRADVSTVNNKAVNYDAENFHAAMQSILSRKYASFNPKGTGAFLFRNVQVTNACPLLRDCTTIQDKEKDQDPLIGQSVDTGVSQATGKMVDLDPEYNLVTTTLFGLRIAIRAYDAYDGPTLMTGDFRPATLSGLWKMRESFKDTEYPTQSFGASFQSILENVTWSDDLDDFKSDTLSELRKISLQNGNILSMKFDIHQFYTDENHPLYTHGSVRGTIGPATIGEPQGFVRARLLTGSKDDVANVMPFVIRGKKLYADVGNAFRRTPDNLGYDTALGNSLCLVDASDEKKELGKIDIDGSYLSNVIELDIPNDTDESEAFQLYKCDLLPDSEPLMTEVDVLVRPMSDFVIRLNPGESIKKVFFAASRGNLLCGYKITFNVSLTLESDPETVRELPSTTEALTVNPLSVVTDCSGMAHVELAASADGPEYPHSYLDGDLYDVTYCPVGGEEPNIDGTASKLTLHLYDKFTPPSDVSWWGSGETSSNSVYNIFRQYANLYPVMRSIVALDDYHSVIQHRPGLLRTLMLDVNDPGHMPVTRDLSTAKRDMIVNWLKTKPRPPLGKRPLLDLDGICRALQLATQVEHASIPMYLYAYYSIKPGANSQIAEILLSIVLQEMRHLVLVANILNAIEGCPPPNLRDKEFIPIYPGLMPGGLRPDLTLRLAPLSLGLIKDVFMEFEAPHKPMDEADIDAHGKHYNTIGQFYSRVRRSLKHLGSDIKFKTDVSWQVTVAPGGPVSAITNVQQAMHALDEIVEQGEGSNQTSPNYGKKERLSHYYRFAEIVYGRELVHDENGSWSFSGDIVVFDSNGVYPLTENARVREYEEESLVRLLAEGFARSYLDLLNQLHHVFNGHPNDAPVSFTTMIGLSKKAEQLVEKRVSDFGDVAVHAGPPFENPLSLFFKSTVET